MKIKIGVRAGSLIEKGKQLQQRLNVHGGRPTTRAERRDYNRFRATVFILEEDFKRLEKSYNKGIGPRLLAIVWEYVQLILGLLGIVISVIWFLHIILYMAFRPPITPFLNSFFITLDSAWGLFGTIAYGLFSFYLVWCVFKGNFKFGLRVPMVFTIHPMKVGETMMNSFLFNTLLLLLASVTIVQFCTDAFSLYNRNTGIDLIFNVGVRNLRGVKYIWWYYYWAVEAVAFLSFIYLLSFPSDRKQGEKGLGIKSDKMDLP